MRGIDTYHGEGRNDHYPLKSIPQKAFNDSDFVIVKASQGTSYGYQDFFKETIEAAEKAGKLIGAYHYASGKDATKEADYFLARVKPYIGKALLCLDWEATQNKAWGSKTWCKKFIDRIKEKTGITCILYTGEDGIKHNASLANKVPLWFAGYPNPNYNGWVLPKFKYDISPWKTWSIWQYTSSGERIDRNTCKLTRSEWLKMAKGTGLPRSISEADVRKSVVEALAKYLGVKEGSQKHKQLISIFNDSGLCPRYKMTTNDAWCAMTVSDAFIITKLAGKPGSGALFQCVECSCANMVNLAKKQGIWIETDSHVPKIGDVIMYDWQDSGSGDDKGTPDHTGIVASISGKKMSIIEGNYKDSVGERQMSVNGKNIRGYICPDYGLYASGTSEAKKAKEGYKGKFPGLPPRGYYKHGDGYKQYKKYIPNIKKVQSLVNWITDGNLETDGKYGNLTEDEVKNAQGILGIKQDGLFGADTLAKARAYKK